MESWGRFQRPQKIQQQSNDAAFSQETKVVGDLFKEKKKKKRKKNNYNAFTQLVGNQPCL